MSAEDAPELWIPELTDSVDAQFGGEYSEETMNMVKAYPKPTWLEEPSVSYMQIAKASEYGAILQQF